MIFLGKIIKVRGNKGEVVVAPSPKLDTFIPKNGESIIIKSKKYQRSISVDYYREISGICTIKFNDTDTINDALKLVGYSLYNPAADLQEDDSIIEFAVQDVQGNLWGIVKDLEQAGLSELLEVEDPEGDLIYIPFADAIVKSIDKEMKMIVIDPPNGLRDLNK